MHTSCTIATPAVLAITFAFSSHATAQPLTYNVVEIQQQPQNSFSYAEVVGNTAIGTQRVNLIERPVTYGPVGTTFLSTLDGYTTGTAAHHGNLVNDFVGYSRRPGQSALSTVWLNGIATNANTWAGREVWMSDVNDSRQFVGSQVVGSLYEAISVTPSGSVTVLSTPDDTISSIASMTNNAGDIAGTRFRSGFGWTPCRWRNGVLTDLQLPPGLPGNFQIVTSDFMNESGVILGSNRYANDGANLLNGLFFWNEENFVQVASQSGIGNILLAKGLSDTGLVAYQRNSISYLWFNGTTYSPNQLTLQNFSGHARDVWALGTNGVMLATVSDASGSRFAMLVPVPSPAVSTMLLTTLACTSAIRRRTK